jgi:hypothetical protein
MGRLMAGTDLVGRLRQARTIVGLDRKRIGFGIVGLRQAGQCGHGEGPSGSDAAIMRRGGGGPGDSSH